MVSAKVVSDGITTRDITMPVRRTAFGSATITTGNLGAGSGKNSFSTRTSTTATITVKWVRIYPGEPVNPPAKPVYFRIDGSANYHVAWNSNGASGDSGAGSGSCDDSLNDATTITPSPVNTVAGVSSGTHLVQRDPSRQPFTFSISASAIAKGSGAGPTARVVGSSGCGVTITLDHRSLALRRPGAINETVDSTGTTHGDTTYSYYEKTSDPFAFVLSPNSNVQRFSPVFSGSWGPIETWNWTPRDFSKDTVTFGDWHVPFGKRVVDSVHGDLGRHTPPRTQQISYEAKDSRDGLLGRVNYLLSIHEEIENFRADPDRKPTSKCEYFHAIAPDGSLYWADGPLSSASANVTITYMIHYACKTSGKFTYHDFTIRGMHLTPSEAVSFGPNFGVNSVAVPVGYRTRPYIQIRWRTKHYLDDEYGANGFLGTFQQSMDDPIDSTASLGWSPREVVRSWTIRY